MVAIAPRLYLVMKKLSNRARDSFTADIKGASRSGIKPISIRHTRPSLISPQGSSNAIKALLGTEPKAPSWTGSTLRSICELPEFLLKLD